MMCFIGSPALIRRSLQSHKSLKSWISPNAWPPGLRIAWGSLLFVLLCFFDLVPHRTLFHGYLMVPIYYLSLLLWPIVGARPLPLYLLNCSFFLPGLLVSPSFFGVFMERPASYLAPELHPHHNPLCPPVLVLFMAWFFYIKETHITDWDFYRSWYRIMETTRQMNVKLGLKKLPFFPSTASDDV